LTSYLVSVIFRRAIFRVIKCPHKNGTPHLLIVQL
jgi:hypothetical protein